MAHQFQKHYSREEARSLLPKIREWLRRLDHFRERLERVEQALNSLRKAGEDLGGEAANNWVRLMLEMRAVLLEFYRRDILIKDAERGLIDFPAIIGGREVFLCWEKDEEDIEFWHDLDTGYAGRERLEE
jgi:hypothetical protein